MKLFEFTKAMIFAIPLGIFTILTALMWVINAMKVRRLKANHQIMFISYFACATLLSALFIAYYYYPAFFKQVDIVYFGALVFTIILFHQFHCVCIGLDKRFNSLHYIVPTIVFCVLLVVKLFLPDYQPNGNYDFYFYIILIFSAYYILLGLYETHLFYIRQSIAYGSTKAINQHRVRLLILEKLLFPTVFGLLPFIGGQNPGTIVSILLMATILAALYNNIPLVYSIIRYFTLNDMNRSLFDAIQLRRPITEFKSSQTATYSPVKRIYRKYSQRNRATGQRFEVNRTVFERYFRKHKPYLNPSLTINDLIEPLQCNRTYLSRFVNRTYGMNFSNYINGCRLREMDRLLTMQGNSHKTPALLYSQAGFKSYRNYQNAKAIKKRQT